MKNKVGVSHIRKREGSKAAAPWSNKLYRFDIALNGSEHLSMRKVAGVQPSREFHSGPARLRFCTRILASEEEYNHPTRS